MDEITVTKDALIERLRHNRDQHHGIFEKAQEAYRARVIEELDRALQEAKKGHKIIRFINLAEPEDHTADFDTAIQMLEWDTAETVTLDRRDFMRYVQNKWEWEASFAANTASYLAQ